MLLLRRVLDRTHSPTVAVAPALRPLTLIACAALFIACGSDGSSGTTGERDCSDGVDNDEDGAVDCDDRDCRGECRGSDRAIEDCANGTDDDGDGLADCLDPECEAEVCSEFSEVCDAEACRCPSGFAEEQRCADGQDDDCDGATDCVDRDCADAPECDGVEVICDDGLDDDGDGAIDCDDADCAASPLCGGGSEVSCDDGVDNDGDGATDCFDSDCAGEAHCASIESECGDGLDNDGDAATDCADPDCVGQTCGAAGRECSGGTCVCPGGAAEVSCDDGVDDDCDGALDCADSDCSAFPGCAGAEVLCANGADDDGDGRVDCADDDCAGQPCGDNGQTCASGLCRCPGGVTETACSDRTDNDCDGAVDCLDPDCSASPACQETNCEDRFDNDGDGAVDCDDSDCSGVACGAFGLICAGGECECPGVGVEICGNEIDDDCNGTVDDGCAGPICESPIPIACGASVRGDTSDGPRNIENFGCTGVWNPGPEVSYVFSSRTAVAVTAILDGDSGLYPDLDIAAVGAGDGDCDVMGDCIVAEWGATNDEELEFDADAGATYYIIVDSGLVAGNSYSLDVSCE